MPPISFEPEIFFSPKKVHLDQGVDHWIAQIKSKIATRILNHLDDDTDKLDRYVEIIETEEIPGAYLCCSFYQRDINEMLTRLGLFMGAGKGLSAGTVVGNKNATLLNYRKLVAGHNLPGSVVRAFFDVIKNETRAQFRANPFEKAFSEKFLNHRRVRKNAEDFYVVGFSIQNTKSYESVLSHEIFHAKYFLDERYRQVVTDFWHEQISDQDKEQITRAIAVAYNVESEDLVIDEFQGYLLQNNASADRMKNFVTPYRDKLKKTLAADQIDLSFINAD